MPGETRISRTAVKVCPNTSIVNCTRSRKRLGPFLADRFKAVISQTSKLAPSRIKVTAFLATGAVAASYVPVSAQTAVSPAWSAGFPVMDQPAILLLAVFGGAVSFALLSAFWLIRERARIGDENIRLKKSHSGIRADRDRLASLVEVDDQCIVMWDGKTGETRILGKMAVGSGAPESQSDFLGFGRWLSADSAARLEKAIESLRSDATQFTFDLKTKNGNGIEAQGRVSGGHAFVRFTLLEGSRQELARLKADHSALFDRFALIEALFEQLQCPVWIRDAGGRLAYANAAYASAVECENSDMAVRDDKALFDEKERNLIATQLGQAGHLHQTLPAVVAGDRKHMETIAVATDGGSCGMAIDRSDIEEVRTTLKHAIAGHQQTFDHLGTAIAIFDADQKLQFHNSSFQQLWNLAASELEDGPTNSHVLDVLRNSSLLPEQQDWKRWKAQQLEIYHATEAKSENWHLTDGRTLRVIVNPQNHGGASWVFENVTEELALRSTYNSLVRVQGETLDHLNDAVAVFGSDGKIRLTNPAFQRLWQFDGPQEVEGHHIRDVTEHITSRLTNASDWQAISLGITGVADDRNDFTGRLELSSGTVCDYHVVYLPEGQSMLTLADMTAAVHIERALKERNDALEASDALKNRFIQHVSYELRAPLTSISGFAEILASDVPGKLNSKQAEYLDYIAESSDVLKALIDDILDLATIDAGAMELDLEPVALAALVDESLKQHSDTMDRFGITAHTHISAEAEKLIADPARLSRIISNLVSNAVNVSPDGGSIEISAARSGDMIEVSVCDQGPGISSEHRQSVFQRFETVQGGDRKRGAGLGLSIVKSFAELHGGNVRVEDADGQGARFVCQLPLEPAAGLQAAQ